MAMSPLKGRNYMALSQLDREILDFTIELASKSAESGSETTPSGAAVTVNGEIVGFSQSWVERQHDPLAHAGVLAIQKTCKMLGSHLIPGAVLYSSLNPCFLCLTVARWTGFTRVVYTEKKDNFTFVGEYSLATDVYYECGDSFPETWELFKHTS